VNEFCETAIAAYFDNKTAFAEDLTNINRRNEFQPSGNKNIRIHGTGCRYLEGVLEVVPVKILAPASNQHNMLEHAGILHIIEGGI